MATKKAAKKASKSKRVTPKTPARRPAPRKPKNPKGTAPAMDPKAAKAASPAMKGAIAGAVPPKLPEGGKVTKVKEADAIELLRRTCAKGQMVVGGGNVPLAQWLQREGLATIEQRGPTWRLYPTTSGRKRIRESV